MNLLSKGFLASSVLSGLNYTEIDEDHKTLLTGWGVNESIALPAEWAHFGVVISGEAEVYYKHRRRIVEAGDYFCVNGFAEIKSAGGTGFVTSAYGYLGFNVFGGEIEATGRLKYIDGCTDSLLVPPVKRGDPCLNHLHFPLDITQTPHTHPSVRAGIVYRGSGECVLSGSDSSFPLNAGTVFLIRKNTIHSFNTTSSSMDIIAFHPDSDTGVTDDDHPMVNRTLVDGVAANSIPSIRTGKGN